MDSRPRTAAILAAGLAALTAVILVLYGMDGRAVHAGPPPVLDRVKLAAAPSSAPAAGFSDASGRMLTLADFRGRAVVLNLWATWCAPCVTELPELAAASAALPKDKVAVVAVDLERLGPEKVGAFLKEHHASALGIYTDGRLALMRAFETQSLPYTVLLDAAGRVVATASGPQRWNDPAALAYLKRLAP